MIAALLPCPFCGHEHPEFERMGDRRQSCIVICGNCGARHESGDEGSRNGSSWNQRSEPGQDGLRATLETALARIEDMLADDDGQAFKEARKFLESARQLAEQPGFVMVQSPITEDMHVAAVKVLHRANGVEGLPQRMLDAMTASPTAPQEGRPAVVMMQAYRTSAAYDVGYKDGQKSATSGCGRCDDSTKPCDITGSSCAVDASSTAPSTEASEPVRDERAVTANDVYTLIGHAEMLTHDGQTDMPQYLYELATRLAEQVGDPWLINRAKTIAARASKGTP